MLSFRPSEKQLIAAVEVSAGVAVRYTSVSSARDLGSGLTAVVSYGGVSVDSLPSGIAFRGRTWDIEAHQGRGQARRDFIAAVENMAGDIAYAGFGVSIGPEQWVAKDRHRFVTLSVSQGAF